MASSIPIGRAGLPDEIAECVSWLVSPAAAYITGAIVPVSGGR
jgi:NAD(P)-dependent dehydrogenase (short-subunit alcohol dehydrogenase family)